MNTVNTINLQAVLGDGWWGQRISCPINAHTLPSEVEAWQAEVIALAAAASARIKFSADGCHFTQYPFWVVEGNDDAELYTHPEHTGNGLPKKLWVGLGLMTAQKAASLPETKILGGTPL